MLRDVGMCHVAAVVWRTSSRVRISAVSERRDATIASNGHRSKMSSIRTPRRHESATHTHRFFCVLEGKLCWCDGLLV